MAATVQEGRDSARRALVIGPSSGRGETARREVFGWNWRLLGNYGGDARGEGDRDGEEESGEARRRGQRMVYKCSCVGTIKSKADTPSWCSGDILNEYSLEILQVRET